VFVRCNDLINVALRGQEGDAELPVYGRSDVIRGDLGLSCTRGVQSVYVNVRYGSVNLLLHRHPLSPLSDCAFIGGGSIALGLSGRRERGRYVLCYLG